MPRVGAVVAAGVAVALCTACAADVDAASGERTAETADADTTPMRGFIVPDGDRGRLRLVRGEESRPVEGRLPDRGPSQWRDGPHGVISAEVRVGDERAEVRLYLDGVRILADRQLTSMPVYTRDSSRFVISTRDRSGASLVIFDTRGEALDSVGAPPDAFPTAFGDDSTVYLIATKVGGARAWRTGTRTLTDVDVPERAWVTDVAHGWLTYADPEEQQVSVVPLSGDDTGPLELPVDADNVTIVSETVAVVQVDESAEFRVDQFRIDLTTGEIDQLDVGQKSSAVDVVGDAVLFHAWTDLDDTEDEPDRYVVCDVGTTECRRISETFRPHILGFNGGSVIAGAMVLDGAIEY